MACDESILPFMDPCSLYSVEAKCCCVAQCFDDRLAGACVPGCWDINTHRAGWNYEFPRLFSDPNPLAGADDLLLVMASVLVGTSLGRAREGSASALSGIYKGIVAISALNLALQVAQVFGMGESVFTFFNRGLADTASQIVRYSEGTGGASVFAWDRFPGIFVQPFEAGVFYGLAIILWAFRWGLDTPRHQAVYGCIIVSGAALAGSKAALPAIAIVLLATLLRWEALPRFRLATGVASFGTVGLTLFFLLRWLAVDPLARLGLDQGYALSALSGGRFGAAG